MENHQHQHLYQMNRTTQLQALNQVTHTQQAIFKQTVNAFVKCKGGNLAHFICYSKKCQHPAFTCKDKSCLCRELHLKCIKVSLAETIQNLQKKIINFQPLIQENDQLISKKIDDLVNKILEQMSKAREQVYDFLVKHFEFHGLSQLEKQFYKLVKQNKISQITGQQIFQLFQEFYQEPSYTLEGQIQKIKQFWENSQIQTNAELNTKIKQIKEYFQYKQYNMCQCQANILTSCQDLINLNQLFNYKIQKLELLYIASQSNFQTDQFRFDCKDIPHTLTLIETNGKKKIGGYTPLTWSTNTYEVNDKDKKSFLFSLTNKEKLIQQSESCGIANNISLGPTFKNSNNIALKIINESNKPIVQTFSNSKTYVGSQFSLISGFRHKNYQNDNENSCLRFGGVKTTKFTTQQWQVWKVIFKQNKPNKSLLNIKKFTGLFEATYSQSNESLFGNNSKSNGLFGKQ